MKKQSVWCDQSREKTQKEKRLERRGRRNRNTEEVHILLREIEIEWGRKGLVRFTLLTPLSLSLCTARVLYLYISSILHRSPELIMLLKLI